MATFTIKRPQLLGYDDEVNTATTVLVDASGTAFTRNDIVTVATTGLSKLVAGGASAVKMALAAEDSADSYTEPIVGQSQGRSTGSKQVLSLKSPVRLIMSTKGALAQANIGVKYALAYNSTSSLGDLTLVVDQSTTSNSVATIQGVADPEFGGDIGDTSVRVIVQIDDSAAF